MNTATLFVRAGLLAIALSLFSLPAAASSLRERLM